VKLKTRSRIAAWSGILLASTCSVPAYELKINITPYFSGALLIFDSMTNLSAAGQKISVTRLDFLLSDFALAREDGTWLSPTNAVAFLGLREGRTNFQLNSIGPGNYRRIRFHIGLSRELNHKNPASYPAGHPLNPEVNGLHWGWMGGYVFLALEGNWAQPDGRLGGYSYHLATDRQLMTVDLPISAQLKADCEINLTLDVAKIFDGINRVELDPNTTSTHSRTNDLLAGKLQQNVERAFSVGSKNSSAAHLELARVTPPPAEVAATAHPYAFTFPEYFLQPELPRDNPLSQEGVELGRRLFFDPSLSINNSQSCASCHHSDAAFSEHKTVSTGAEGVSGTRNAMAPLNLAWKSSFFWDGRAASLREQVLQPIQNPLEMHESLNHVVAKLAADDGFKIRSRRGNGADGLSYKTLFEKAFGTPEITSDRIARALEQFLLVQTSFDSKFDRVLKGEAQLTEQEQRGFELFHTEYDPRHEQYGADCFHCHGGPLFRSQTFANNGLNSESNDLGRFLVTHKGGDKGKFAVPSLRNVELTAPYMHDGRFRTLEEVIDHYTTGVKRGATLDPNLARHPDGGVPLSPSDKRALVAFLKTLTDERFRENPKSEIQTTASEGRSEVVENSSRPRTTKPNGLPLPVRRGEGRGEGFIGRVGIR
jgi:cytochrome c peroxidase